MHTAERVIHTRLKKRTSECGRNKIETIHSTGSCDYKENCFLYGLYVFLSDVIKKIYSAFIMQRNVICQYWFLEMHSLSMADELRSFQFLDINEVQ